VEVVLDGEVGWPARLKNPKLDNGDVKTRAEGRFLHKRGKRTEHVTGGGMRVYPEKDVGPDKKTLRGFNPASPQKRGKVKKRN